MFQCSHPGCMFVHSKQHRVNAHISEVHNVVRPYSCETCGHAFKRPSHLRAHMITHTEREVFMCQHMGCFFKTFDTAKFEQHVTTHTSTPSPDATFEAQVLNYFQPKYTCLTNKVDCTGVHPDYTYVLIDCVMVVGTTLVLLECDEKQHKDNTKYSVSNEVLRMKVATAALQRQYPNLSLLWLRFNPHGYTLNGRTQRPVLAERLTQVNQYLREYTAVDPVAIVYAGYDRVMDGDGKWVVALTQLADYDAPFAKVQFLGFPGEDASVAVTVDRSTHQLGVPAVSLADSTGNTNASAAQFECGFCQTKFVHRHHMQRHVREVHLKQTRTEKSMFACPRDGCGKTYTQGHSLRAHMRAEHGDGGRVECPECHTWHSNHSNLQTHMRLKHAGTTSLQCPHCAFTTVYTQSLTKHIGRKHT